VQRLRRAPRKPVIDEVIAADPERYELFARLKSQRERNSPYKTAAQFQEPSEHEKSVGSFVSEWIAFERISRELARTRGMKMDVVIMPNIAQSHIWDFLGKDTREELEHIRKMRNNLVHGVDVQDADYIMNAAKRLEAIVRIIRKSVPTND
jgi:hypothetical protein